MKAARVLRPVRRILFTLALVAFGILLYAICVDIFGGYPQAHSELLSWIAVIVIVIVGLVIWYRDEHR